MKDSKIFSFYRLVGITLVVLGVTHCAMVFVFYDSLTSDAIFSIGTGLGVIFLGMLNISAAWLHIPQLITFAVIANLIQTLYAGLSLLAMNNPQGYAGVFIFLTALLTSCVVKTKMRNTDSLIT